MVLEEEVRLFVQLIKKLIASATGAPAVMVLKLIVLPLKRSITAKLVPILGVILNLAEHQLSVQRLTMVAVPEIISVAAVQMW